MRPLELIPDGAPAAPSVDPLPYVYADAVNTPALADELIEGLVSRGSLGVWYGASGCGKTFLALHAAACVQAATPFLGRQVRQANVVYFAAEAGRSIINRAIAWRAHFEIEALTMALVTVGLDMRNELSLDTDAMIATIQQHQAAMVVIDTWNATAAGGDENSSMDVGLQLANARRIIEATGVALIVIHHSGKVLDRGMRGHSSFHAAADAVLEVTNTEGIVTAKLVKHRDAPSGAEINAKLRVVDLGARDSWGKPLTSCIVEPVDGPGVSRATPKLPKGAALVLRALNDVVQDLGTTLPATSGIPPGVRGVHVSQWRDRYYTVDPLESDAPEDRKKATEARQKRFARGMRDLQDASLVGVCNTLVWAYR